MINPLYAILSGFKFGDTPGISTFYDFFSRLWDSEDDNLSPHEHPLKKKKVKKPKTKGAKADSIEKVSVAELLPQLESKKQFKCPKISRKNGCISCTCETPCSDAKYGRTIHLVLNDNPRLFNNPPRGSKEWKLEYNARTSVERSNKREKIDFRLENGRHRSTKMWCCRLYHILMLQHLDAWNLPNESALRKLIQHTA